MTKKNPKIFVISGPGGVGKTTLIKKLFTQKNIQDACILGITVTTRKKRPKEVEEKDYFFVDKEEFSRLVKHKFFLESQKIIDDYYGTPKIFFALAKAQKKDLVLCIDVKGGLYLKKTHKAGKIITVFITAPTKKELYRRMQKRAESKAVISKRIKLATQELKYANKYKHQIVNKTIDKSLKVLEEILLKAH